MSKADLAMMTRSLAQELAPDVRVNGISRGAILWPEGSEFTNAAAKRSLAVQSNRLILALFREQPLDSLYPYDTLRS